jgi:hypothetical protein
METSTSIKEISKALFQFQGKLNKVTKSAINPHFKKTYADLNSILDACYPVLQECGLMVTQHPHGNDLVTTLIHAESGEYFQSFCPIKSKDETNPQAMGSGITYARRYALQSILCLSAEDDDGNAASTPKAKPSLNPAHEKWESVKTFLKEGGDIQEVFKHFVLDEKNRKELLK